MKKITLNILFTLLCLPGLSWTVEKNFEVNNLRGMISNYGGINLKPEFVTDAQNVHFDKDLGPVKRNGYSRENAISFGSQTVSMLGQYITLEQGQFLMVITSNVFAYNDNSVSGFTTIISTVDSRSPMDCVSAMGRFICTSDTQAFYWIGGPKTVEVTTAPNAFPLGTFIAKHVNRVWVAGVKNNPSILYASGFLNADNWVLGGNAGDPAQFTIGINDGDSITGLYSFGDAMVVFKQRSTWAVIGKNQNNFEIKNISNLIGCIQHRSIRDKQGKLYWLSNRGLEKLENGVISQEGPFSDPIKNVVDKIVSGLQSVGTDIQSQLTESSSDDFELSRSSFCNNVNPIGSVSIQSPSTGTFTEPPGEGCFTDWDGFRGAQENYVKLAVSFVPTTTGNLLLAKTDLFYRDGPYPSSFVNITLERSDVVFSTKPSGAVLASTITRSASSTGPSFIPKTFGCGCNSSDFGGGVDLGFSTITLFANTTYWLVFTSTNGNNFFCGGIEQPILRIAKLAASSVSTGKNFKYTKDTSGAETLAAGAYKFEIFLSSGQFVSPILDFGANIKSFSIFDVNYALNGGTIFFYSKANNLLSALSTMTFISQVAGSTFAPTVARFGQWMANFGKTGNDQTPSIQDVSINWVSTGTVIKNAVSWVFDDQYWISASTDTGANAQNNTIIIVDRFDNFSKLNGINALSFAEAFEKRYFGTSISTGGEGGIVNRFTTSFADNGKPIDAFFETKDYCWENCEAVKAFSRVYVKTKNDGVSGGVLATSFQFNKDGTYTNLGDVSLTEGTGFIVSKVYFPLGSGGVQGKTVRFRFRNNQAGHDFRFYGARVFYDEFPIE